MLVDLYASRWHYLEHLAPVWNALEPYERGMVAIPDALRAAASGILLEGGPERRPGDVRLAAGWTDVQGPPNGSARVLMEHGVGQRYVGLPSPHYVGGSRREHVVDLFLLPNDDAARAERGRSVVVGSPFFDQLMLRPHEPLWDAAFSFHFKTDLCPEASGYPEWFLPGVAAAAEDFSVLGHGHPRAMSQLTWWYDRHAIPWTSKLDTALCSRCFVADNTSAMFYAAALGIPVVVLNPPYYRRNVKHGVRFWDLANIGINVSRPEHVAPAVRETLDDPHAFDAERKLASQRLFPFRDGRCAARCAEALRDTFDG